ncbi:VWA domain-containing protein [Desulfoferrobacter suflitae]|uniref:VWA domain-containing protein n=1 Tax=Desulfoferrobacter suflitae TaxID=2865782 RepID=UPI002164A428|nr:VWA domain-containing protein [Desulfoferrobacter suflitae]MCK8603116.1 VWA domain-containing protein [Desulfoferrobacter suflitae]
MTQGALPIIAAALGRHYGVRVVVGDNEKPRTDGKVIYLPTLDDSPESAILASGFIDHEASHVRLTDFSLQFGSALEQSIWNSIEDVRCERELGEIYPGSAKNLDRLVTQLVKQRLLSDPGELATSPGAALDMWTLYMLRAVVLNQEALNGYARTAKSGVRHVFGDALTVAAEQMLLEKVPKAKSSKECRSIARELLTLMGGDGRPNQTPPEQPKRAPEKGSNQDKGSGTMGKQGDKSSPSSGSLPSSQGNQSGTNGTKSSQVSKAQLEKTNSEELLKGLGEILQAAVAKHSTSVNQANASFDPGWENGGGGAGGQNAVLTTGQTTLDMGRVRKVADTIRAKVLAMLQASANRRIYARRFGLRLERHSLSRILVGDPRIFVGKSQTRSFDTAVHVLMDRSGSMKHKMNPLCESALAIATALYGAKGVSLGVSVFPAACRDEANLIVPHNSPVKPDAFTIGATGGTPLTEALWYVIRNFIRLPQKRKIIIVVTDGGPNKPETARQMASLARNVGFETYGIGIATAGMEQEILKMKIHMDELFTPKNASVITNIYGVTDAMMSVIEKTFL